MRKIYQAANLIDAHLCRNYLEANGISSTVTGAYLSGAIGELPADATPTVWILEDDTTSRALELIREFEGSSTAGTKPWQCPRCCEMLDGNFGLCWKCGTEYPHKRSAN